MTWLQWWLLVLFLVIIGAIVKTFKESENNLVSHLKPKWKIIVLIPLIAFLFEVGLYWSSSPPSKITIPVMAQDKLAEENKELENAKIFYTFEKPVRGKNVWDMPVCKTNKQGTALVTIPTFGKEEMYLIITKEGYYPSVATVDIRPSPLRFWEWMNREIPQRVEKHLPQIKVFLS